MINEIINIFFSFASSIVYWLSLCVSQMYFVLVEIERSNPSVFLNLEMFIFGAEFNKETVDWILNKTKLAIIENCREDTRRHCIVVKWSVMVIWYVFIRPKRTVVQSNCIDLVISRRQCTSMSTQTDYIYPTPLTSSLSLIRIIGQVGGRFSKVLNYLCHMISPAEFQSHSCSIWPDILISLPSVSVISFSSGGVFFFCKRSS